MKTKTTTEVIGALNAYIEYGKTWKEARVPVLMDAVAKIDEMRRALDEIDELERDLSVRSLGFGEIARRVT